MCAGWWCAVCVYVSELIINCVQFSVRFPDKIGDKPKNSRVERIDHRKEVITIGYQCPYCQHRAPSAEDLYDHIALISHPKSDLGEKWRRQINEAMTIAAQREAQKIVNQIKKGLKS